MLPSHLHHEVGRAVLEAGKHLLMEKPMALSIAECDDLVQLAQAEGLQIAVGHEFRFSALWGKVKELVDAGAIGDPQYALIELWRNPYRLGSDGWRYDIKRVGNWILEEPIHFFDLARWYFVRLRQSGVGLCQRQRPRPAAAGVAGQLQRHRELPRRTLRGDLADAERLRASSGGEADRLEGRALGELERRDGPHVPPDLLPEALRRREGRGRGDSRRPPAKSTSWPTKSPAWPRRSETGRPPRVTGEDGRWSVAMCLKAQESVDTGAVVKF